MLTIGLIAFGISVFALAYHYNAKMLDWLKFESLGTRDYIVERLASMFIEVPPHKILMGLFAISFGLGGAVFLVCLPNLYASFILGSVVAVVGWKIPRPIVDYLYRRRVRFFISQMVDGLSLMSNGMKSGLSVVQALGLVVQEMPNPIQQEFGLILNENKLGVPLEEAFTNLSKRIKSDDVEMFVTSINILKETGGNLAETFDTIVTTIRDRIKIENKIAALTAQGFYQGVFVIAIPPILALVFYQTDPEFMKPLFVTAIGWVILLGVLFLEALGFFLIMKIIKIDV